MSESDAKTEVCGYLLISCFNLLRLLIVTNASQFHKTLLHIVR